jgi:DNA-binding transcriptional MerR regulator
VPLSVSQLATRTGISPDAVRYYGRLGLLPEAGRTGAGHRYYDESAIDRVRFIKGAQWFELSLEDIRELLTLFDAAGCPCTHTRALVRRRIAAIDEQRGRLDEVRAVLCRLLGEDPAIATDDHDNGRSGPMTDEPTTTAVAEAEAGAGCGCCRPPEQLGADEEVRELLARKEAVERRLAGLQAVSR